MLGFNSEARQWEVRLAVATRFSVRTFDNCDTQATMAFDVTGEPDLTW